MKTSSAKRWTKLILIISGATVILGLVFVTVALIICDDDDYRNLAVWSVEHLSGYRLIVDGPFGVDLSAKPSLTAERIRFEAISGGPSPHLKSIGRFNLQIGLKSLLLGTLAVKQLQIADVVVEDWSIRQGPDAGSKQTRSLPNIVTPVFENVLLENIILQDSNRKMRAQLIRLSCDDVEDSGPLNMVGVGSVNGTEFQIDGRLAALKDIYSHKQPYPLDLNLRFAGLSLSIAGTVADYEDGEGLKLQVSADEQNLVGLFKLLQIDTPSPGLLNFRAMLSGNLAAPQVSDLKLTISGDPLIEISAEGSVSNLRDGDGTDILLSVWCRNQNFLQKIFPDDLKVVKEFKLKGAIHKVSDGYRIEDLVARVANDKGIILETGGWLQLADIREALSVKSVDLNMHLSSPHTESIRPLLTNAIPEIGPVDGRGRLIGPVERLALEDLHIIRGGSGSVRVETHGRIGWIPLGDDERLSDMDLTVSIQAEQSGILSSFYGVPIEEIGSVSLTGRVTGATDRFQIKDIEFHSKDAKGLETILSGGIDFGEQANGELLGDVNFKLEIKSPNMRATEPLLGTNLVPNLGPVSAKGLVLGTTKVLSIEDVDIAAGKADTLQIKWQGRVGQFPLGDDRPIAEVQTFGSLDATKSSDFAALFGIKMPDIGPVHATWREFDRSGTYGVDDVKFVAGDGKTFRLNATGRVASVIQNKKALIDGVALKLDLKASDTHRIFKLFGMQLPNLGVVDGRLEVAGGQEKLTAKNFQLDIRSSKGLKIAATGGIGDIGLAKGLPIRDIKIKISAQAPGISALPLGDEQQIPDLGLLLATARIGSRDHSVNVDAFEIRAGPPHNPLLQMKGTIDNIGQREKIKLAADFKAESRPWFDKFLPGNPVQNRSFAGTIHLAGVDDQGRIARFELSTGALGGLSLVADRSLKPGADSPDLELHVVSKAEDPAAWGSMFGVSLPPLSPLTIDGRYSISKQERIFEGETRLGSTHFLTAAHLPLDHPRFRLDAKLSSKTVHLNDLGFYPGDQEKKTASTKSAAGSRQNPYFDDQPLPLDNLKSNDFSLNIHADQVVDPGIALGPFEFDVELKDGRLRIGTSEISYQHGQLSLESIFDASGAEPRVSLKIAADDLDVDDILSYLHEPLLVEGQLNLAVDLHSQGESSREIAANLSGEFGAAIENGKIQRGVEMIASDALDLLFSAPTQKTFTDLNCMAGRLDFQKGVGTIQVLYLDTPGVRARGFGTINLASETLDILINPESKRRLFKHSSPVRIKGKLNDPSYIKIPTNEAVILAGQLAVPIIALPARALGLLWSLISEDKDENSPCLTGTLQKTK